PGGMPPAAPKKKTGLIVGGGIAAVALVVGGVLAFGGGDDDKGVSPATTTLPGVSTTAMAQDTTTAVPVTTLAPATSVVLTLPPTNVPPPTQAPTTADAALIEVFDDTNSFSALIPNFLEIDTRPIQSNDGFTVPSITAATSVDDYNSDHVTFGFTLFAVPGTITTSTDDVLNFISPGEGECSSQSLNIGYPTAFGSGTMVQYDGCGDGSAAKVLIVVRIDSADATLAIYYQAPGASADLLSTAQTIFETMREAA
ncbi:MAG: hypothetical protein KDB06_02130, partial [Ilumatobacter sp.]|nr:hypothetical protein [Ilumatobacter sp.]MCB0983427.1 hypothetical protein [Ilumatobacter sp.]